MPEPTEAMVEAAIKSMNDGLWGPVNREDQVEGVTELLRAALAVSPGCRGAELAEAVKELLDTKSAPPAVAGRLEVEKWVALEKAYAAFRASGEAGPDQWRAKVWRCSCGFVGEHKEGLKPANHSAHDLQLIEVVEALSGGVVG